MTFEQSKAYLDTVPLVEALWWFTESINDEDPTRAELFFYLRERYRNEYQGNQ